MRPVLSLVQKSHLFVTDCCVLSTTTGPMVSCAGGGQIHQGNKMQVGGAKRTVANFLLDSFTR